MKAFGYYLKTTLTMLSISLAFPCLDASHVIDATKLTVSEIKLLLDNNLITSEEVVQQYLDKIDEVSPVNTPHIVSDYAGLQTFPGLNAFVFLNPNALQLAQGADQDRANGETGKPLLGVPISVKDTIPLIGFNNSSGNFYLQGFQPTANDPGVQRLIDAGAIILGQNNMHEFGSGLTSINFSYGPVRNARDNTKVAGGSTGGGAAAVAAKIIPAAIGDDIGGSLRIPAALNGIIGFRPSYARYVSNNNSQFGVPFDYGLTPTPANPNPPSFNAADGMDVRGIEARSIDDVVLLDKFLSEDGGVGTVVSRKRLDGIRLGIPDNFYVNMEPEIIPVVNKALKKLEAKGATLVYTTNIPNIDPPVSFPGLLGPVNTYVDVWANRVGLFFGYTTQFWSANNSLPIIPVGPDTLSSYIIVNLILSSVFPAFTDALDYDNNFLLPSAALGYLGYQAYFASNNIDAIVYPTSILPAVSIETVVVNGGNPLTNGVFDFIYTTTSGRTGGIGGFYTENIALSPYFGTPSLSVPIGLTDDQLPVGFSIEGLRNDDAKILEIGTAFEFIFKNAYP